jgi:hypothetical protein
VHSADSPIPGPDLGPIWPGPDSRLAGAGKFGGSRGPGVPRRFPILAWSGTRVRILQNRGKGGVPPAPLVVTTEASPGSAHAPLGVQEVEVAPDSGPRVLGTLNENKTALLKNTSTQRCIDAISSCTTVSIVYIQMTEQLRRHFFARSTQSCALENLYQIVLTFLGIPWITVLIVVDVAISVTTLFRMAFESLIRLLCPRANPLPQFLPDPNAEAHPSKLLIVGADRACRGFLAEIEHTGTYIHRHQALAVPVSPTPTAAAPAQHPNTRAVGTLRRKAYVCRRFAPTPVLLRSRNNVGHATAPERTDPCTRACTQ